jgi:hypothetical protein
MALSVGVIIGIIVAIIAVAGIITAVVVKLKNKGATGGTNEKFLFACDEVGARALQCPADFPVDGGVHSKLYGTRTAAALDGNTEKACVADLLPGDTMTRWKKTCRKA